MTASSTRVGASGRDRPCSQLRSVAGGRPNFVGEQRWIDRSRDRYGNAARIGIDGGDPPIAEYVGCDSAREVWLTEAERQFVDQPQFVVMGDVVLPNRLLEPAVVLVSRLCGHIERCVVGVSLDLGEDV